jgi:sugar phosphate isomerase/epimerase
MLIALQEDMLLGVTPMERFEQAKALGVDGVEVWGAGLTERVPELMEAAIRSGVPISTVNNGRQSGLLDPDPMERARALDELRSSIMCASDLGAKGVIFVPHFGPPVLPDLSPYKSADELEIELLIMHLRTLEDFADAMSVDLYIEPIRKDGTHLINRLDQAAMIADKLNHPRVQIVADLFHMASEEASSPDAIRASARHIGHVHLADHNRMLPGQGATDWKAAGQAFGDIGYTGWAAFEPDKPGNNGDSAERYVRELPASLKLLRDAGF